VLQLRIPLRLKSRSSPDPYDSFISSGGALTYQDHNEAVPVLDHLHNAPEKSLNELSGLREPL